MVCPVLYQGLHALVNARTVEEKVLCDSCTFACLHALLVACPGDLCLRLRVAFAVFLSLVLVVVSVLHTSKFRRFLCVSMHVALRERGSCSVVL